MGLSIGLNTAMQALRAHQLAVDVASHNIANAQSPGYTRQRLLLRPIAFEASGRMTSDLLGKPGQGVDARDVNRVRDQFLDFQARQVFAAAGQFSALTEALEHAEFVFNEPGDDGLQAVLGRFWSAWHDVVSDPESIPARTTLLHAASMLASRLNTAARSLSEQRQHLDTRIGGIATRINDATAEIAALNRQIVIVEANGDEANDLRDRRDVLLDELSHIGNVTYRENPGGAVSVFLGDRELVVGAINRQVEAIQDPGNGNLLTIVLSDDLAPVDTSAGELAGLLQARDTALPGLLAKLDALASGLIAAVNGLHSGGYGLDGSTGLAFFAGTDAATIALDAALAGNPQRLAVASAPGAPGNSAVALSIARLQQALTMTGGTETFDGFYASLVATLGADVAGARSNEESATLMADHLEALRQSVAGVSIDEEVLALNAAQHAYNAAGRVITTIDEMLDTLINRTGVFGR